MHTDDDFLRKLLDNPADDTARLVYADWLDEQDDPTTKAKAEFLRLTVRLADPTKNAGWRKARRKELQQLAAGLDTDWLAVVSRLKIENCAGKRAGNWQARYPAFFEFVCPKQWVEMQPTGDQAVRFCEACQETVHYCDTITVARQHAAAGHCIAIDLGVIRRPRDWAPELLMLGRPSPQFMQREAERLQPDAVSAERERRKQAAREQPPGG